jgi:hypothetical protein
MPTLMRATILSAGIAVASLLCADSAAATTVSLVASLLLLDTGLAVVEGNGLGTEGRPPMRAMFMIPILVLVIVFPARASASSILTSSVSTSLFGGQGGCGATTAPTIVDKTCVDLYDTTNGLRSTLIEHGFASSSFFAVQTYASMDWTNWGSAVGPNPNPVVRATGESRWEGVVLNAGFNPLSYTVTGTLSARGRFDDDVECPTGLCFSPLRNDFGARLTINGAPCEVSGIGQPSNFSKGCSVTAPINVPAAHFDAQGALVPGRFSVIIDTFAGSDVFQFVAPSACCLDHIFSESDFAHTTSVTGFVLLDSAGNSVDLSSLTIVSDAPATLGNSGFVPTAELTPVPEPGSAICLLTGVLGLLRRRKAQRSAGF